MPDCEDNNISKPTSKKNLCKSIAKSKAESGGKNVQKNSEPNHDGEGANIENALNEVDEPVEAIPSDTIIPLLDQPTILEGSRHRPKVSYYENKINKSSDPVVSVFGIPPGKGTPLGRLNTYDRIKKLNTYIINELHRVIFGRRPNVKPAILLQNIQQFRGFSFEKDSEEYSNKLYELGCKMGVAELKSLAYAFDIDGTIKSKEDYLKYIMEFLLSPKSARKIRNPSLVNRPKRKATKRNYFEESLESDAIKRKKKSKAKVQANGKINGNKKQNSPASGEENTTTKNDETDEQSQSIPSTDFDKNDESKKPAKKRKQNQSSNVGNAGVE